MHESLISKENEKSVILYSPIVLTFISVDVNVQEAEDEQLYLNYCVDNNNNNIY